MDDLARGFEKFPQILINVRVRKKRDYSKIAEIQKEIEAPVGKNDLLPIGFQLLQNPLELLPRFDLRPRSFHTNLLTG